MNKADGGNRKFILIEMMDYAASITAERVKRVIQGLRRGQERRQRHRRKFQLLRSGQTAPRKYIWFMETKTPHAPPMSSNPYYPGRRNGTAYYFYYKPYRAPVLGYALLSTITEKADEAAIHADRCSIGEDKLAQMSRRGLILAAWVCPLVLLSK